MTSVYNFTSISLAIEFYGSILIGSFGVLTNTLNLIVSSREKVRTTNAGFYSTFISIFSLLAIVFNFLDFFPESIGQQNFLNLSIKFLMLLFNFIILTNHFKQNGCTKENNNNSHNFRKDILKFYLISSVMLQSNILI